MSKDLYISFILDELKAGNVERGKVMATFGKKWQVGDRTFDRYWKNAQIQFNEWLILQDKAKDEVRVNENLNAVKQGVIDKNKALAILSKIAEEETKLSATGIVSAKTEQINAVKAISEIEGWNAPSKVQNQIVSENKIIIE